MQDIQLLNLLLCELITATHVAAEWLEYPTWNKVVVYTSTSFCWVAFSV
jgi:hypothetical protein